MALDEHLKTEIEKNIDKMIKDVEDVEKTCAIILQSQEIDPNIDTVLSMIVGLSLGDIFRYYRDNYNRFPSDQEFSDLFDLLKRRTQELRQRLIEIRLGT